MRLRKRGVTILYISHKMDEVFHLSDRITVLRDGRLVKTLNTKDTSPQEVTHLMVGRDIEAIDFGARRRAGDVLLKVENLSLPWPGHARGWRLKDISFELRRGEVLGIAGLMGAGRTELLEMRKAVDHYKARGLDYSRILHQPKVGADVGRYAQIPQDHGIQDDGVLRRRDALCTCAAPSRAYSG